MGGLFGGAPKPKAPPPPETVDEGQEMADAQRRSRLRRGRASTQLVQQEGAASTAGRELTGN